MANVVQRQNGAAVSIASSEKSTANSLLNMVRGLLLLVFALPVVAVAGGLSISYYNGLGDFAFDDASYDELRQYFDGRTPDLTAETTDIGSTLDFGYNSGGGASRFHGDYSNYGVNEFYVHLSGDILAEEDGNYKFGFTSDDGVIIFVDGQRVVDSKNYSRWSQKSGDVSLLAGAHAIDVYYVEYTGPQGLCLYLKMPSDSGLKPMPQSVLYPLGFRECKITFDANGGMPTPADIVRKVGEAYGTLPTVTRDGYAFKGWYTAVDGGVRVSETGKVRRNETLYAHWNDFGVSKVIARQRYPWNGLVDIVVTIQGKAEDLPNTVCSFVATNSATKTAIPVEHITRNGSDTGSGNTWTRKFIWDAKADIGAVKIDDVMLTVAAKILGGVQLWENGPYWAECNVGASQPEEYGYYFWWGDTVGYKRNANDNGWVSVKDEMGFSFSSGNCPTYGKNKSQLQSEGYIDSTGNLVAAHDAATAHLGAPWRMPTDGEFAALISNCTTTWTTSNGVPGRLVRGKGTYASKSIFLPAAGLGDDSSLRNLGSYGYYWSSAPYSDYSDNAWSLSLDSGLIGRYYRSSRGIGQSVRPVRGFAK